MSDRTDFGAPLALVGGSVTLFATYMYWVVRTDGLHSRPPSVLGMALAHPLSVLGPVVFVVALTYAVGGRLSVERRRRRLERATTGVAVAVGVVVGTWSVAAMFLSWAWNEGQALSVGGFTRALVFYPDTILLLTVVVASPVYLGALATKWLLSLLGFGGSQSREPSTGDHRPNAGHADGGRRARSDVNPNRPGEASTTRSKPVGRRSERSPDDRTTGGRADRTSDGGSSGTNARAASASDGETRPQDDGGTFAGGPIPACPAAEWETLEIERSLERGGSLARTADGERVVVEQLTVDGTLHTEAIDAFVDDAETWDGLAAHDHVLGVAGYGGDPVPWLAVEYPDGGTLAGRSDLSFRATSAVAVATCDALRFAHNRGVIHGALRPEHVAFRERNGAVDVPKLGGWTATTGDGVVAPAYAAPEQFTEERADAETDVYRMAAVCYELFTGRPPFEGEPTQVMGRALTDRPTPPSEVDQSLPTALDELLLDGLATDRSDRYDSVVYLRDGVARIASERDV